MNPAPSFPSWIPSPDMFDPNSVIVASTIDPFAPLPLPDGQTMAWRLSGTYVYAMREASEVSYQAGVVPYMEWSRTRTDLDSGIFDEEIIDSSGGEIIDLFPVR